MKKGFTLIELLVVVAIIGILASVVLASLNTARAKARDARKIADFKQITNALELYYDYNGYYPNTVDCSGANHSGWVYDDGRVDYTPDGIILNWSQLTTALAPYIKLPISPGSGRYRYGATLKDYKLDVSLQANDGLMLNDGGNYPSGVGCPTLFYEVFSKYRGSADGWTCHYNMCTGF